MGVTSIVVALMFVMTWAGATASAAEPIRSRPVLTHSVSSFTEKTGVPSRFRQPVDEQVDPDGYILKPALRGQIASLGPPSCVEARDEHPDVGLATVVVVNGCPVTQRVKVLIAFWFDSACLVMAPKSSVEFQYANGARFDGLVMC